MSNYSTGQEADRYGADVYGTSDYGDGYRSRDYDSNGGMQSRRRGQGTGAAYQMAPMVVGGLMAALGLKRGGWLGYGIALAGLGVMQQSFSGRSDVYEWIGMGDKVDHESRAVTVSHAVTIDKPASELYAYWRDFSNLSNFMENLERIEVIDRDHSRWTAKGPAGMTVSWEAEVTDDRPDSRIAWRSKPGADVPNWGHVEFRPAPRGGTEVHAVIRYEPPAGMLGRAVAKMLGREPQQQMKDDLARFKRMMETGQGSLHASNSMAGAYR
ncbi:SRPBCC family protein [Indioceanicola profundi]|uniref:SRPBCC family protein n=1 Tax=Indioceanicola profundi TaxID=2220096 RepID=UPI000E6AD15A|nr:SRPBCC family protein [Indioceanicola profundi]